MLVLLFLCRYVGSSLPLPLCWFFSSSAAMLVLLFLCRYVGSSLPLPLCWFSTTDIASPFQL
jgi:hypothetical protein